MRRLIVDVSDSGKVSRQIENFNLEDFDTNEVLIQVAYSSLNYKDALSASGNKGISRFYPHTPGIDAVGIVSRSSSSKFREGDKVIITGFDLGMNTKGGYSDFISVPANWVLPLPKTLSPKESMALGTAGLTAGLSIDKILCNSTNLSHPILVSGASGGVGTLALAILKKLHIPNVALSRKTQAYDFLFSAGADSVISELENSPKPLLKSNYSAAIDTVGGKTLESILKQVSHNGHISICGMAESPQLSTSVFPFILRGITMYGIDSAETSLELRNKIWEKLATTWKPNNLESIARTVKLENLEPEIENMLAGNSLGRVIVEINSKLFA